MRRGWRRCSRPATCAWASPSSPTSRSPAWRSRDPGRRRRTPPPRSRGSRGLAPVWRPVRPGAIFTSSRQGRKEAPHDRQVARRPAFLSLSLLGAPAARACGGFFCTTFPMNQVAENILFVQGEGTVTTHVQLLFSGSASDFAWILPVPSVPDLAVSHNQIFARLLRTTRPGFQLNFQEDDCVGPLLRPGRLPRLRLGHRRAGGGGRPGNRSDPTTPRSSPPTTPRPSSTGSSTTATSSATSGCRSSLRTWRAASTSWPSSSPRTATWATCSRSP